MKKSQSKTAKIAVKAALRKYNRLPRHWRCQVNCETINALAGALSRKSGAHYGAVHRALWNAGLTAETVYYRHGIWSAFLYDARRFNLADTIA